MLGIIGGDIDLMKPITDGGFDYIDDATDRSNFAAEREFADKGFVIQVGLQKLPRSDENR